MGCGSSTAAPGTMVVVAPPKAHRSGQQQQHAKHKPPPPSPQMHSKNRAPPPKAATPQALSPVSPGVDPYIPTSSRVGASHTHDTSPLSASSSRLLAPPPKPAPSSTSATHTTAASSGGSSMHIAISPAAPLRSYGSHSLLQAREGEERTAVATQPPSPLSPPALATVAERGRSDQSNSRPPLRAKSMAVPGAGGAPSSATSSPALGPKRMERDRESHAIPAPSPMSQQRRPSQAQQQACTGSSAPSRSGTPLSRSSNQQRSHASLGGAKKPPVPDAHKFIHTVPLDNLRRLAAAQLDQLWGQYDSDGNGVLDRRELSLLASDCIARTLRMAEEEIRATNPGISDSTLRDAMAREKEFILPGGKGSKEEVHQQMVRHLVRQLDVNGDGCVTRAELMMQWNKFSNNLFRERGEVKGAIDCSIM